MQVRGGSGDFMSQKEAVTRAIAAHGTWKLKFEDFMEGKIDLDELAISRSNLCDFGKWLEGEGKKELAPADYQEVHRLHADFHMIASLVVRKKKSGDADSAWQDLSPTGAFTTASAALTLKMMAIRRTL